MLHRRDLLASAAALLAAPQHACRGSGRRCLAQQAVRPVHEGESGQFSHTVTSLGLDTGARAYQKSQIDDASLAGIAKNKAITASQLSRLQGR